MKTIPKSKRVAKDSAEAERLNLLFEAFRAMEKTQRAFSMYAKDHEIVRNFLEELGQSLCTLVQKFDETWIEVKADALYFGEHEIYREEQDGERFVFGMHRDGIRRLCFLPGLNQAEIERLAEILWIDLDSPQYADSDRSTLFWDAEFESIRYIVAEVLATSEGEEEEEGGEKEDLDRYKNLMNSIITLATSTKLPPGYKALNKEKMIRVSTHALANIDQDQVARTLTIADETGSIDPFADSRWMEDLRAQYQDTTVLPKFAEILFRGLVQTSAEENPAPLDTLDLLFDILVEHARCADLLQITRMVQSAKTNPRFGSPQAAERLFDCLFQPDRIRSLVAGLDRPEIGRETILELLRLVPSASCAEIMAAGARLQTENGRADIVGLMSSIGAERPELVAKQLQSPDPTAVEMAFKALIGLGTEPALEALSSLRRHPSPNMRLELLRSTEEVNFTSIRKARAALLKDENARVRAEAERCLAKHRDAELVKWLYRRVNDGELLDCSFIEKRRVCELLATSGGPRELRFLRHLVEQGRKSFIRQRTLELCAAAAYGLAATGDLSHADLLDKESSRWMTNRRMRTACNEALAQLRETHEQRGLKTASLQNLALADESPTETIEASRRAAGLEPQGIEPQGIEPQGIELHGTEPHGIDLEALEQIEPHGIDLEALEQMAPTEQTADAPYQDERLEIEGILGDFLQEEIVASQGAHPKSDPSDPEKDRERSDIDDLLRQFLEKKTDPALKAQPDPNATERTTEQAEPPEKEEVGDMDRLLRDYLKSVD